MILLFMYIFSFPIPGLKIIDSSIIAGIFLCFFFVSNEKFRNKFIKIIKNKKIALILLFLVIIILYCFFISTIQQTYDYSIIKTFANQFIHLIIALLIYSYYCSKDKENLLFIHIIYIFIFQSFIQFISFMSPEINEFLNIFRSENAIIRGQAHYGRIRGLAISGSAFFGLGVGYGLVYIYYFANWDNLFCKFKIFKYFFLLLLLFGGMSSARSSMAGFIIGLTYLFIKKLKRKNPTIKKRFSVRSGLLSICVILVFFLVFCIMLSNENIKMQFNRFNNFAFEIFHNFLSDGEFRTTSTEGLFKMYFPVRRKTLLIGDAMYTNNDGSYYMYTDAGYMRNILYFGLPGFLLLLFYQTRFFIWQRTRLLLNFTILIYILIMHIKGDVLGFSIILQSMLFLVLIENVFNDISAYKGRHNRLRRFD